MTDLLPDRGVFTVSLDFELYWGVRDKSGLEAYSKRILETRDVIPRLLDLFARWELHVTWATVGFLFFDEKDELLAHLPKLLPGYVNKQLSPYDHLVSIGPNERKDPFHYGRSLILRVSDCPNQEIGTHTFSHYYCLEDGQTLREFRADLDAAHAAARLLDIKLKSLVFPRNQWRPDYLAACAETGIGALRGNEQAWMYRAGSGPASSPLKRVFRFADAYVNISGHHGHGPRRCGADLIDVPSSRFLRPVARRLAPLDPLRLRRIRASMDHAAANGLVYHLWWHPHNFGTCPKENLTFLSNILEHFRALADQHGMESRSMGELIPRANIVHAQTSTNSWPPQNAIARRESRLVGTSVSVPGNGM